MNRVQLIGWLGGDPAVKTSRKGDRFAYLRLATNHFHRDPAGGLIKRTDWHHIYCWQASHISHATDYLMKGSHVMIEGRVVYRTYLNADGQRHFIAEIRASQVIDLDR